MEVSLLGDRRATAVVWTLSLVVQIASVYGGFVSGALSESFADSFASSLGGPVTASSLAESFAQGNNNAPAFASASAVSVAEVTPVHTISGSPSPQGEQVNFQQSIPTVVVNQFEAATPVQEPGPTPVVIQSVPVPQPAPIVVQSVSLDPPVTPPVVVQSSPDISSPQPATVLVQSIPAPQPSTQPNQVVMTVLEPPAPNNPEITQQSMGGIEPCDLIKQFFICGTWGFDETVESLKGMLQLAEGLPSGQAFVEDAIIFDPNQCHCAAELNVTYVVSVNEGDIPQDQDVLEYLEGRRALIDEVISRSIVPNEGVSCVIRNKFPTELIGECGQDPPIVPQSVPDPSGPQESSVAVLSQNIEGMSTATVFQDAAGGGCTVTAEITLCLEERLGVLTFITENGASFSQQLGLPENTFAQSVRYQDATAELNGCVPGKLCNCQLVLRLLISVPVTTESADVVTQKLDNVASAILGTFTGTKTFFDATCSGDSVFASARTSTQTASIAMVSVVGVLVVALLLVGIALMRRIRSQTDAECNRADSFSGSEVWDPQPPVRYPIDRSFRAMTPRRPADYPN